jgi:hypothetical protein
MKLGVLTNLYLREWVSDALGLVKSETDLTIELVVINTANEGNPDDVKLSNDPRPSLAAIRAFTSKLRDSGS